MSVFLLNNICSGVGSEQKFSGLQSICKVFSTGWCKTSKGEHPMLMILEKIKGCLAEGSTIDWAKE